MLKNRLFDENDGSNQGGGDDSLDSSNESNESNDEGSDDTSDEGNEDNESDESNEGNESSESSGETETLELSNEQISVVRLLLDPNTRKATIRALAQREGLNLSDSSRDSGDDSNRSNRSDESKTAKNLVEEIQEIMGDDFDQLPKKFWKALERVVDAKISPVTSQIERNAMLQSKREVNEATNLLFKNFQDARKYSQDITQLTERYTPSEDQTAYEFLEEMYLLAKSKRQKSANSTDRKFEIRVKRNSKDAIQNASGRGNNQNNNFNQNQNSGNKRRSIDDAINMAFARRK